MLLDVCVMLRHAHDPLLLLLTSHRITIVSFRVRACVSVAQLGTKLLQQSAAAGSGAYPDHLTGASTAHHFVYSVCGSVSAARILRVKCLNTSNRRHTRLLVTLINTKAMALLLWALACCFLASEGALQGHAGILASMDAVADN
jgi:hypothetical protein